ncbi:MAG: hypothetical protein ACJ0Q3_09825 [Candidatus Azotimanducaceae bacterium]
MAHQKSMGITFGSLGVLGPKAITNIASKAQALGYRSIWTVEATGTDALTMLGAVSQTAPQSRPRDRNYPDTNQKPGTGRYVRSHSSSLKP